LDGGPLLAPLRLLRLATLPPRIVGHALFRHRFGSLRLAVVLLGVAAVIGFFVRRKDRIRKA
jgi:hypothetical protein